MAEAADIELTLEGAGANPAPSSSFVWTQGKANTLMASAVLAWGFAYVLMKLGVGVMGVLDLVAMRFTIAFVALVVVFWKRMRATDLKTLGLGAILGFFVFIACVALMYGVRFTTASAAAFFCSAAVVIVPILQALLTRKAPSPAIIIGTVSAAVGIALLSFEGPTSIDAGAGFCLLGAFLYAVHVILIDRFTKHADALLLGIYQLGFAGAFGIIARLLIGTPTLPPSPIAWAAVLGLALLCSAFAFVAQVVAQAHTTPYHAAITLALEPVFAAMFAFILLSETLTGQDLAGAALVLFGVFVASGILNKFMTARHTKEAPDGHD